MSFTLNHVNYSLIYLFIFHSVVVSSNLPPINSIRLVKIRSTFLALVCSDYYRTVFMNGILHTLYIPVLNSHL